MCFEILFSFGYYWHIFYQDHNTLASIVCFKKLFIFCSKNVASNKNFMIKFTFSICNQQLSFTLAIPFFLYINNDDNNGSKVPTLKIIFEFFNGIHVEKHGNQLRLKISDWWHNGCWLNCNNNMHVTFFKSPFGQINSMLTFFTHTNMHFYKYCSWIFLWGDFTPLKVIVVRATLSNKS